MERFYRHVELAIGPKDGTGIFFTQQTENANLLKATNLKIHFDVKKSSSKDTNEGTITVIGMADSTLDMIRGCKNPVVQLRVGHLYTVNDILYGNLMTVNKEKNKGDKSTVFKVVEGVRENKQAVLKKSYAPGTKISTIVNDCKQALGAVGIKVHNPWKALSRNEDEFEILNTTVRHGVTAHESALSVMTKILRRFNYKVYVSNNALIIATDRGAIDDQGVILNSATGLLGYPAITKEGIVKVKALIDPRVTVGSRFKLESGSINNFFTVRDIQYVGDNFDGPFEMDIEAV